MPGNAFVYGTLMSEEVVRLLLKRVPPMRPATLDGYRRFKVKRQVFPAIVPKPDSKVHGQILEGLTPHELQVLDEYEAEEYSRISVQPVLQDGSTVEAYVYVWKDKLRDLLEDSEWDYAEFCNLHLAAYAEDTAEFIRTDLADLWAALPSCERPTGSS